MKFIRAYNLLGAITEFGEVKIAAKTFLFMLIPVAAFIVIFEILIPKDSILNKATPDVLIKNISNIKIYIIYLVSGVSHIIISLAVIVYMTNLLFKDISRLKKRILKISITVFIVSLSGLFLISDYLELNLALLSHERIYSILIMSDYFSPYFKTLPELVSLDSFNNGFYLFSIMPFSLIFLGLIIIVFTCFNIGKDLNYFFNMVRFENTEEERARLLTRIKAFHNYLYILSFILVTSIIATIFFMQIPLVCLLPGDFYQSFLGTSVGMGICWGVIFSLTMLFMCFYPFILINKKLKSVYTNIEITGNDDLKEWIMQIQNNYLIYKNIKTLLSVLSPIIISLFTQFF